MFEYLPYALSIGVPEYIFWDLNPKRLKPYVIAEKMRLENLDYDMWKMGIYVRQATLEAVGKCIAGEKCGVNYFEKPLLDFVKEEQQTECVTEDEQMEQVNAIFNALAIRAANSRLEKQQEGRDKTNG